MTDEQMDARLRRAGEAWRAASPTTNVTTLPEPHDEPLALAPHARRRARVRPGLLLSAAAVAAALVAGIAVILTNIGNSTPPAGMRQLESTVWRLTSYGARPGPTTSTATLVFNTDGTFVADDMCQLLSGSVHVQDGRLHFLPTARRHRDCTDSSGDLVFGEQALETFTTFPTYSVDGSQLTLDGRTAMHFRAAPDLPRPTTDVPTVDGATWQLVRVKDGSGTAFPVTGKPTFRLDSEQSTLEASDGCNTITWDTFLLGRTLKSSTKLASTGAGCRSTIGTTAAVVDSILQGDATESVRGATMTITHAGHGTLSYQWVPGDKSATDPAKLINRTWHLRSVAGSPVPSDVTLRIDLTEQIGGLLSGFDGCHTIVAWPRLHHGWWTGTQLLSPGATGPCDTTVHSLLSADAVLWAIRNGELIIYGNGSQAFALVYGRSARPGVLPQLAGVTWTLSSSGSTGPGVPALNGGYPEQTQLRFDGRGGLTIRHRCYVDQAHVTIGADTLDITDVTLDSAIPCPSQQGQAMEQRYETFIDHVLSGNVGWTVTGGELHLTKSGTTSTTLDFRR